MLINKQVLTTLAVLSCLFIAMATTYAMDGETKRPKTLHVATHYYSLEKYSDHAHEVLLCAQAGAYTHDKDIFDRTGLHKAAQKGESTLVKALMQGGIPADCLDAHGNMPLHYASQSMHQETVELLIEACIHYKAPNINPYTPQSGIAPMVDVINNHGQTPLHLARCPKVVQLLIESGANCHAQYLPHVQAETPFQAAVRRKDIKVIEAMIHTVSPQQVLHIVPHILAEHRKTEENFASLQDLMSSIDPTIIKNMVAQRRVAAEQWLERPNIGIFFPVKIKHSILKALRKYPEIKRMLEGSILTKRLECIRLD